MMYKNHATSQKNKMKTVVLIFFFFFVKFA